MEENIKLIKEKIKKSRELFAEVGSHIFLNEETIIAIEKLIDGYLEKEKECKEQYEWNIFYRKEMGKKNIQIQNTIPITLIQNKIENLKSKLKETMEGKLQRYTPGEIMLLQGFLEKELLEERNK